MHLADFMALAENNRPNIIEPLFCEVAKSHLEEKVELLFFSWSSSFRRRE
jgi:hypothetical protein